MEMVECQTEFPHTHMDRRPRRLACWDVVPEAPKAQLGMFYGQDVGNITNYAPPPQPSDQTKPLFVKGVARNCSPPWHEDDKDGHYMFAIGDNLTARCKYT
ncbi:dual-specificity kinase [Ranunculus cassubicifolius]